ncbi:MAG: twin-arginine translocase TatA/TatE family subunit [Anaerolineae bacterium]|nr:twin-arginine translocase TatA/TatE family subunit [Anaerolineae bacterium]
MFGLQPQDLLIILIVALLLFGPSKLPEIGKALGRTIREFQTGIKEATQALSEEAKSTTVSEPKCKTCNQPIPAGAKFCTHCGASQT